MNQSALQEDDRTAEPGVVCTGSAPRLVLWRWLLDLQHANQLLLL